ncbi:MAG: DNA replication and repair protein RecF [Melioribacteraceae bacterium]|nr:DNA replication and repair protein RecF [Melioribacteraceae bacterium]MCF8263095.1 DNA replication and repair protein RecF [Melioribacteraceae bacterium]MCF8413618.1 DNA replication and repair protein RecF [Melioribacteraceae bacterium]MCF8430573.1 DNA replication and repair protein RecF [Melioribacteraceae bacterium]
MTLNKLFLTNFRLHENTTLEFSNNLNYIVGGNGQGKTSILEAIYYLCTTRNISQSSDQEAVTFSKKYFELNGNFKDLTTNKTKVFYDNESNRKNYFLDDKQIYRASSIIGKFPVVTLTPSDHSITMGSPADRRKFIDSVISQSSDTYLKILMEYNKTIKQRSSLLSQLKDHRSAGLLQELDAWDLMLAKNGAEIIRHRINFLNDFELFVKEAYHNLMEEVEVPEIFYSTIQISDFSKIEEDILSALEKRRKDELIRGTNLVGPHRDDFVFSINGLELKKFGSQGQHKTFQIALRFGQFFFMNERLGRKPIFLMDDVFGELDTYRANKISEYLKDIGQAFITMTDFSNVANLSINETDRMINVHGGVAEYVS